MSFFARIAAFFAFKTPKQTYDAGASAGNQLTLADAQLKQQAAVQKMRRGVADVSVSRQRLDLQAVHLQVAMDQLSAQAKESEAAGDGAAAQTALGRHLIMGEQMADLISQRDALAEQETMLIAALTQLQARVAGFNVTAETLKATHTAADARHRIASSLDDLDGPAR
ncbi:PspA/IM30 family protein [Arthrobacter sp. HLT1-20]